MQNGKGGINESSNVIIVGDFLKDLDDEHTLCVASKLHRDCVIKLVCVVGTLNPQNLGLAAPKELWNAWAFRHPVGVGTAVLKARFIRMRLMCRIFRKFPKWSQTALRWCNLPNELPDQSVVLILQSGLTDAFNLFNATPLFL